MEAKEGSNLWHYNMDSVPCRLSVLILHVGTFISTLFAASNIYSCLYTSTEDGTLALIMQIVWFLFSTVITIIIIFIELSVNSPESPPKDLKSLRLYHIITFIFFEVALSIEIYKLVNAILERPDFFSTLSCELICFVYFICFYMPKNTYGHLALIYRPYSTCAVKISQQMMHTAIFRTVSNVISVVFITAFLIIGYPSLDKEIAIYVAAPMICLPLATICSSTLVLTFLEVKMDEKPRKRLLSVCEKTTIFAFVEVFLLGILIASMNNLSGNLEAIEATKSHKTLICFISISWLSFVRDEWHVSRVYRLVNYNNVTYGYAVISEGLVTYYGIGVEYFIKDAANLAS